MLQAHILGLSTTRTGNGEGSFQSTVVSVLTRPDDDDGGRLLSSAFHLKFRCAMHVCLTSNAGQSEVQLSDSVCVCGSMRWGPLISD